MTVIALLVIVLMARIMVDIAMSILRYLMAVNHYRVPERSWRDEVVAILMTASIASPIIYGVSMSGY